MDISIVLPVHEVKEELLIKALESAGKQDGIGEEQIELLIVHPPTITEELHKILDTWVNNTLLIKYVINEEKTDFQSQVNLGAKNVKTKFFTILEFDDEYSTTYFKTMKQYINSKEFKDVDVFLPILVEATHDDKALKLTNETVWSKQFVGENGTMGYLNVQGLNQYTDFKICGALLKTEEYNSAGGLKSNIKLTFQYEFLLRYLNNASKIYSVPKIGYKHLTVREGSLFDVLSKTMDIKERGFWFETAKKEANFFNDRPIDMTLLEKAAEQESK